MLKKKINKWLYEKVFTLLKWQAKVKLNYISVEGYRIAYLEGGNTEKKTLILIHGSNDEKESWLMMVGHLKKQYHLILIDLLGCGQSALPEDFDYSLRSQASFLEKIIKKLMAEKNITNFHLAGHSMGGLVVLLADKLPIDKLILIDTMGITVKDSYYIKESMKIGDITKLPWLNLCSKENLKQLMKESNYTSPYIPNFMLEHMVEKMCPLRKLMQKKFAYLIDENMRPADDLTDEIKNIKQETLILWGKQDKGIDVSSAHKMDELIKNSKLIVYDGAGHYPHVEKPKDVARDIALFLG